MKKIKIIALSALAFVTIASTVFVSCQKQSKEVSEVVSTTKNIKKRTSSGVFSSEYSNTILNGLEYREGLNKIGEIHNEYQKILLTNLLNEHVTLNNQLEFIDNVKNKSINFFNEKGMDIPVSLYNKDLTNDNTLHSDFYSLEGFEIINELNEIITSSNIENDATLFEKLNNLQTRAINLNDEKEIVSVGIPVTIAIYSFNYWKTNGTDWANKFSYLDPNSNNPNAMHVGWGQLGVADVGGAISGGYSGVGMGPGGVLAGATLGASGASLFNLFGQIASSKFSWY